MLVSIEVCHDQQFSLHTVTCTMWVILTSNNTQQLLMCQN